MSTRSDKVLQDLLKQPFGPYPDDTILSKQCKHTSSKRLLLEDLMLSYKDKPTGFDRTEFEEPFIPSNAAHLAPIQSGTRVLFRGVLSILALTHLSDKGIEYLNNDFKERVMRSTLNGIKYARKYSSFDMKSIFESKAQQKLLPKAEQYEVRVLIQGYMCSRASFMRSDVVPDGLLLYTANAAKTIFRFFEIVSMDTQTYKFSRTFLFRHHTLKTLRDILSHYKSGVPTHKRSPQWFLEHYFHGFAYPSHRRWSRINSIEDADSSDEGPNQMLNSRPANAQTHRPRHLRVVHKNEVWSIFASHAHWIFSLVQDHKDLKSDVHSYGWESFLSKVPQLRKKAMSDQGTNGRWGLRDEQKQRCKTSPVVEIPVPRPTPTPKSKLQSKPQLILPTAHKRRSKSPPAHEPPPKRHHSIAAPTTKGPQPYHLDHFDENLNVYDSDFSQVSSSSHRSSSDTPTLSSLPHVSLLPPEMFAPPTLPADLLWHCPVGGGKCTYTVDLRSPSQDNLRLVDKRVPNDSIDYLLNKDWKCNDEQVMMVFYEIVNAHWEDHLKTELGIEYVRRDDASTFVAMRPEQKPLRTKKWEQWRARIQRSISQAKKQESPAI